MSTKKDNKVYKDSIRVVNMSSYQTPSIEEVHNKEWVSFGDNNDYFDNLIDRYVDSPTNGRCINGIIDMIYGRCMCCLKTKTFAHFLQTYILLFGCIRKY